MMYSPKVMDHFVNPRNMGELEDANAVGEVGNPVCGDIMKFSLKIKDGIIEDVRFKTFGCGAAVATSSMATELIKGKPIEEALKLTNTAVVEALDGLPPVKIHCSVLAEQVVKAAVADYYIRWVLTHPHCGRASRRPHDHAHDHDHEHLQSLNLIAFKSPCRQAGDFCFC